MKTFWFVVRLLFIVAVVASFVYFASNLFYTGVCIHEGGAERAVVTLQGVYCYYYFEDKGWASFMPLDEILDLHKSIEQNYDYFKTINL
jgi:hypothetical protein